MRPCWCVRELAVGCEQPQPLVQQCRARVLARGVQPTRGQAAVVGDKLQVEQQAPHTCSSFGVRLSTTMWAEERRGHPGDAAGWSCTCANIRGRNHLVLRAVRCRSPGWG